MCAEIGLAKTEGTHKKGALSFSCPRSPFCSPVAESSKSAGPLLASFSQVLVDSSSIQFYQHSFPSQSRRRKTANLENEEGMTKNGWVGIELIFLLLFPPPSFERQIFYCSSSLPRRLPLPPIIIGPHPKGNGDKRRCRRQQRRLIKKVEEWESN